MMFRKKNKKEKTEICLSLGFHKKQPALIISDIDGKNQYPITMNEPATIDQLNKAVKIIVGLIEKREKGK